MGPCYVQINRGGKVWHLNIAGMPRPAGNPPRGEGGGSPPCPALRGRGGSPPRPIKMIKTAGKLRGKIKARISIFLQQQNNITTLNNAQSGLSIGYARESKKWKYLLLFLLTGHQTLFSKICQLAGDDADGNYDGDDNYDGDANCDYDQGYECWVN